ncbi:MAG: hypothetical protein JXB05_06715 [Myxococcaceae bacterium]|nr:hypothetical protein [Myxococcaceae bacterium]
MGRGAGRTGERPALPTGERPALRTGERPALPTGERPALSERGQARTTTRTAMPAATFADAMTPSNAPTKEGGGKRLNTAAETLVMPKVEVPEPPVMTRSGRTKEMPALRDGKGQTPSDPSAATKDGRTLANMSSPVDRGGTRIVRMPEAPGGKERAEGEETLSGREGKELRRGGRPGESRPAAATSPEKDNFGAKAATTSTRLALRGSQVKKPVLPIKELIPATLGSLKDLLSVAKRFASDMPLLHQQIRPSDLPPSDRALRAWAFFTAYAEAATAHPSTPEGQEVFDKALTKEGFGEYRDGRTGQDGVKSAKWVLESSNPEQARERAGQVELEPPQEVLRSETEAAARKQEAAQPQEAHQKEAEQPQEAARRQEPAQQLQEARQPEDAAKAVPQELKDSTFTEQGAERAPLERVQGQAEPFRVNPQLADGQRPVMQQITPQQRREDEESLIGRADDAWKKLSGGLKLGRNMLWNALHRLRGGRDDSAIEKEKWNQIAFAAILSFVGLMLLVILVVSL